MANSRSPLVRLLLLGQNTFRFGPRRKSTSPSSSLKLADQARESAHETRRSNRLTTAALVPSDVVENIRGDSIGACAVDGATPHVPSDVAENIQEYSISAGGVDVATPPVPPDSDEESMYVEDSIGTGMVDVAATIPPEDASETLQHNGSATERANTTTISPMEAESSEAIPAIVVTAPDTPESRRAVIREQRVPTFRRMHSRAHLRRPSLRVPDLNPTAPLRERSHDSSTIHHSPRNTPSTSTHSNVPPVASPRSQGQADLVEEMNKLMRTVKAARRSLTRLMVRHGHEVTPRSATPIQTASQPHFYSLAGEANPSRSSTSLANTLDDRDTDTGPGKPALVFSGNHEYLLRLDQVIQNSANLFPGLDILNNTHTRIVSLGRGTPQAHAIVAVGPVLWFTSVLYRVVSSENSSRLEPYPTSEGHARSTAEAGDRLHDSSSHDSSSAHATDSQAQSSTADDDRRTSTTSIRTREAPSNSTADSDAVMGRVDPQSAPHNRSHETIGVQSTLFEYHGLQPNAFAPDTSHFLTPRQAMHSRDVGGSPHRPIERALPTGSPQQPPPQPNTPHPRQHQDDDVLDNVQEVPATYRFRELLALFDQRNQETPSPAAPPIPAQEPPRPQYGRELTESPVSLSPQLDLASIPARRPEACQGTPPTPQKEQAMYGRTRQLASILGLSAPNSPVDVRGPRNAVVPEAQLPPLYPPGLTIAMNRNPAHNAPNPYVAQASPRAFVSRAIPGNPGPATPRPFMQTPSPARPPVQEPHWGSMYMKLTPAGYPDPAQQVRYHGWAQPAPLPSHSGTPPPGERRKTIRRPENTVPFPLLSSQRDSLDAIRRGVAEGKRRQLNSNTNTNDHMRGWFNAPGPKFEDDDDRWRRQDWNVLTTVGCPPLDPRPHGGELRNEYGAPRIGISAREYFADEPITNDNDEDDDDEESDDGEWWLRL